jgi:hypothetical protein
LQTRFTEEKWRKSGFWIPGNHEIGSKILIIKICDLYY